MKDVLLDVRRTYKEDSLPTGADAKWPLVWAQRPVTVYGLWPACLEMGVRTDVPVLEVRRANNRLPLGRRSDADVLRLQEGSVMEAGMGDKGEGTVDAGTEHSPTVVTCLCGQDFIPTRCPDHCTPKCCERYDCPRRKVMGRDHPPRPKRRCRVCGRWRDLFVRFPSCKRKKMGSFAEEGFHFEPVDGAQERIHVDYCSAICYTHSERGHWVHRAQGQRRRKRRMRQRWERGLGPNPRGRLQP